MSTNVEQGTQISIFLDDRPGALAELSERLGREGLNILAFSLAEGIDHGYVRMVVNDGDATCAFLRKQGLLFFCKPVLTVWLGNRAGALGALCRRWADRGINIEYAYGSTRPDGSGDMLVVKVDQLDAAMEAARTMEWKP
ncbi:MAG: hypothetical protein KBA51_05345 [Kiritimatiellae bacterium]|nr:hypothetical protein [Kiritimatiellia bacterium]